MIMVFSMSLSSCTISRGVKDYQSAIILSSGDIQVKSALLHVASIVGVIADDMSRDTAVEYMAAHNLALDMNKEIKWSNEIEGSHGDIAIFPSLLASKYPEMQCIRYLSTIWIIGHGRVISGDSCRSEGGSWIVVLDEEYLS